MASRMRIRAQLKEDYCEVKALMRHPMETGMRKDQSGAAIPANFIEDVQVLHNDAVVVQAYWGAAVSANPFLGVRFKGGAQGDVVKGDVVKVVWRDNRGDSGSGETTIR